MSLSSLNSILVEGRLVTDPSLAYDARGIANVTAEIRTVHYGKVDGQQTATVTLIPVVAIGRIGESLMSHRQPEEIRVVGRLVPTYDGRNGIHAEHVEYRRYQPDAE